MFEVGDRVKFKCRYTSGTGIIVDNGVRYPTLLKENFTYAVKRDDGGDLGFFYFNERIRYFKSEELEHVTKFYTPEQTGDTDDDI